MNFVIGLIALIAMGSIAKSFENTESLPVLIFGIIILLGLLGINAIAMGNFIVGLLI